MMTGYTSSCHFFIVKIRVNVCKLEISTQNVLSLLCMTTRKSKKLAKEQIIKNKEKAIKKISVVYQDNPDFLDVMADYIAPEFDYEFEGRGLRIEEREGPLPEAKVIESNYPSGPYHPKTKIGKFFLKDVHQQVLALMLLVLIGIMGWYGYYWKTIVSQAFQTTAYVFGQEVEFKQIPGTVRENLEFNDILYDSDDETTPALNKKVDKDTKIRVDEVHYSSIQKTEEVSHTEYIMLDPKYPSGVKVETKGNDGKGIFSYKTKFVNNEVAKVDRKCKKWIKKANDHIIHLGTARTGHTGKIKINKTFTANCSAYWMGNNCRGASGGRCVYGTCAVDPSKYPYGTKFWVEGYGVSVANDCGGAIKGDKLDLWMDSFAESCRWGRRHMTTYVITDVK